MSSVESDQEWLQFVEEVQQYSPPTTSVGGGNLSPGTSSDQLFKPKGSVSKPVRKRSRLPRRAPATVLTANPANFRALVQQFTGRPAPPFSSRSHRGPLTLNFQLGTRQYLHPFESDYHSTDHQRHRLRPHPYRHYEELQQEFFQVDNTSITSDASPSTICDGPSPQDGFTMGDLSADFLSTGITMEDIGYIL